MDYLFTPWRYAYVSSTRSSDGCVFCRILADAPGRDEESRVLHRGGLCFVVLNIYPYNSGHLMVVPNVHASRVAALPLETRRELFDLAARAEAVIEEVYRPDGINIGMNLGACAGAGIADHLHLHVVPRWSADTNFMTISGETRVLPEDLSTSWRRLHGRFGSGA
jgi:ATP adenylyltransferase